MVESVYASAMRAGHVAAWAGQWRDAAGQYRQAVEADPSDIGARSGLASALTHTGALDEAVTILEGLAAEQPDDTALIPRLADALTRLGRLDRATAAYIRIARARHADGDSGRTRGAFERVFAIAGHRATEMSAIAHEADALGYFDLAQRARNAADLAGVAGTTPSADVAVRRAAADGPSTYRALARAIVAGGVSTRPGAGSAVHPMSLDEALMALSHAPSDTWAATEILRHGPATPVTLMRLCATAASAEARGDAACAIETLAAHRARNRNNGDRAIAEWHADMLLASGERIGAAAEYCDLADQCLAELDLAEAILHATSGAKAAPGDSDIIARSCCALAAAGEHAMAVQIADRAARLSPTSPSLIALLARAEAIAGDESAAFAALDRLRALDRRPNRSTLELWPGTVNPSPLAELVEASGRPDDDLTAITRLTALCANGGEIGQRAGIELARRALANRDGVPEAARALTIALDARTWAEGWLGTELIEAVQAVADAANDPAARVAVTRARFERDASVAGSGAAFARALADHLGGTIAAQEVASLADASRARGDLARAAQLFDAALSIGAASASVALRAADCAEERGEPGQARTILRQALEQASAPNDVAAIARRLGSIEAGPARVAALRRAVAASPADVESHRALARALTAVGQANLAAMELVELGSILFERGDREGALRAIGDAAALDPWNPGIGALRQAIVTLQPRE
ncbi:MAG: tetratricopeptide repeat protein [Chloroflexota bacterium]|nr:MAG: tetratricopeptide repeat protein [Chloroflexota bacterium]